MKMKKNIKYSYPWLNIPTTVEFNITSSGSTSIKCFEAAVDFFGTEEFAEIALDQPTISNIFFTSLVATTLTKWVRKQVRQFPYRKISITSLIATYGQDDTDLLVDIGCKFRR